MLSSQEIDLVDNVFNKQSNLFETISASIDTDKRLYDFVDNSLLLDSYKDIFIHESVRVLNCKTDTRLLIAKVSYQASSGKRIVSASEIQLLGLKVLDKDFGHILIRPETIEDKINEFFKKCELDFKDHPDFSSKYYYLAEDESLGRSFATSSRLTTMEEQKDILIEVKGNLLISKYPRILNSVDFSNMVDFMKKI